MSRTYFINTLDIYDLEENSNKFCKCLEALTKLKSGDKLTVSEIKSDKNDKVEYVFEIDEYYYMQSLVRWYYSQGRARTKEVLNKVIPEYLQFLEFINNVWRNDHNSTDEKREKFMKIFDKHQEFMSECIKGLEILKETYSDDEGIVAIYNKLSNS